MRIKKVDYNYIIIAMQEYVRTGFGLATGSVLALLVFMAVGVTLFIVGFILYTKGKKAQHQGQKIAGIVIMVLGCIIGLGFGASALLESIGDML